MFHDNKQTKVCQFMHLSFIFAIISLSWSHEKFEGGTVWSVAEEQWAAVTCALEELHCRLELYLAVVPMHFNLIPLMCCGPLPLQVCHSPHDAVLQ